MPIIDVGTGVKLYNGFQQSTVETLYNGMSALQIYESKCGDANLNSASSLHALLSLDDSVNSFDIGFSPLLGGASTKITWTSEGLIHLYFTGNNGVYSTSKLGPYSINVLGSTLSRAYFDGSSPVISPSLSILYKNLSWDGQTFDDCRVQYNATTCLFYITQRKLSTAGTTFGICIELGPNGQINYYVDNYNAVPDLKTGLVSYDQSTFTGSYTNPVTTSDANTVVLDIPASAGVIKYSTVPLTVFTIQGNVNASGVPYVTSKVTALRKSNKQFVTDAIPDINGDFTMEVFSDEEHILICEDLASTNPKNALIFDRVVGT